MLSFKLVAFLVGGVVVAVGAVTNALWGPRAQARKRLARGTSAIADRQIVTLTGTVRAVGELLVAPLSGKRCVVYQSTGQLFDYSARFKTVIDQFADDAMVPFVLETTAGSVLVDATRPDLELPSYPLIPRNLEREISFLAAHDRPRSVRDMGFEEVVVEPGDRVAVQGMVMIEADPSSAADRGYRDDAPRKIRLIAHANHPLTIGRPR